MARQDKSQDHQFHHRSLHRKASQRHFTCAILYSTDTGDQEKQEWAFFSTFLTSEAVLALLHKQWGLVPVMAVRCPACVSLITLVSSGPTEIWCGGKSILDNNEKFILLFLSPPHPSLSLFLSLHPPLTHSYPALSYSVIYLNVNNHSFLTPYLPSPKFNRKSI